MDKEQKQEKKQEKKDIIRAEGEGFGVISKTTVKEKKDDHEECAEEK